MGRQMSIGQLAKERRRPTGRPIDRPTTGFGEPQSPVMIHFSRLGSFRRADGHTSAQFAADESTGANVSMRLGCLCCWCLSSAGLEQHLQRQHFAHTIDSCERREWPMRPMIIWAALCVADDDRRNVLLCDVVVWFKCLASRAVPIEFEIELAFELGQVRIRIRANGWRSSLCRAGW